MKYKYSRKLLAKAYGGYEYEKDFLEDLLATKPEKEIKPIEKIIKYKPVAGTKAGIQISPSLVEVSDKLNEIIDVVNNLKQK